ncbi:hypothetical protein [Micromonospora echinofusca]|uniref:Chlor_Arch_YYY domain-containing protein n=1 Tax=Micromonospora echinofusca TaxID=47858 RepID=A0ABS3VYG4_MICEH|nr:hypothetical protein [Micromonospora echinofusca]MBO4209581.1 hypothetical protein [Micromonospora echinofusca]
MTALHDRAGATRPDVRPAPAARRFAPALAAYLFVAGTLLATGTPPADVLRYTGYALAGVLLPGTLVYRALRRRPHTLVEDLAMGAAVGLVLELAAWAGFTALGVQRWLWLWPLAVAVPFAAVPVLRRHWWVRGYTPVPTGWAWTVVAVVAGFTLYLAESFFRPNPVLPTGEGQAQYIDLAFQLSIAGAATHQVPLDVPQVAGEPLHYHWFGFAHLAAASLFSGTDLPVVFFRLGVPALCALAAVLIAVAGWRVTGRPYAGAVAAVLMFTVGEFGYENGVRQLFGTQATFIVWGSPSMTYSWVLLIALIVVLADRLAAGTAPPGADAASTGRAGGGAPRVPWIGPGAWVLAGLLLAASTGAKASSVPVTLAALAFTAAVLLVVRRRLVRPVLVAAGLTFAAQVFATAVLFAFESHGVTVDPFSGLRTYVGDTGPTGLLWVLVFGAFLLNMQLRLAGIPVLLWLRRGRLEPVQLFLLGGTLAGPAIYLLVGHPGSSNQYFVRAGFAFGVLLSAWGYLELVERARLGRRAVAGLVVAAVGFAGLLTGIQLANPATVQPGAAYAPLLPLLRWTGALVALAGLGALLWVVVTGHRPRLVGAGGVVLLTGILVAGTPGLVMDAAAARKYPNGGAYAVVPMPASRVEAARWVRDHSAPGDVVATNVHCRAVVNGWCDARSFWLSAYAERAVLLEGWSFAPRMVSRPGGAYAPFWDQDLLRANDTAFTAPTAAGLADLRDRHGVRWLVADHEVGRVAPELDQLAEPVFANGRISVYRLR